MSDRRKRQLPLVKCEDGVERYTRDNEDGVMRWDEREGERRTPTTCPDCLKLAKVLQDYFGQVDDSNRRLGEDATYEVLSAFINERE